MAINNVQNIDVLIGRSVLSLETANKLGEIHDLAVDPSNWELAGFSIRLLDERYALVNYQNVHSIGPDALMIDDEESLLSTDQSQIKSLPLAKNSLLGVKVITELGQLIGKVSNIFIHLKDTPDFIYEVRRSIFDKLLGHTFYFPASLGCAISEDRSSLVVSHDPEKMEHSLDAVAKRLYGPNEPAPYEPAASVQVTVRSQRLTPN